MRQVSILNLLLLTALIGLGLNWYSMDQDKRRQDATIGQLKLKLKAETGTFDIKDPSKIYLRTLKSFAPDIARFRMYLPEDRKYQLVLGRASPKDGKINLGTDSKSLARLAPRRSGDSKFEFRVNNPHGKTNPHSLVLTDWWYDESDPKIPFSIDDKGLMLSRLKLPDDLKNSVLWGANSSPQVVLSKSVSPSDYSRQLEFDPAKPIVLVLKHPLHEYNGYDRQSTSFSALNDKREVFVIAIVECDQHELLWSPNDYEPQF